MSLVKALLRRLPRPHSLRAKIISWAFIPAAIILGAVALVAYLAYQQIMAEMVITRDQQLTRLAAGQLNSELTELIDPLVVSARALALHETDPASQQAALHRLGNHLVIFDGGAVVLNSRGTVVASEPPSTALIGQDWSQEDYFAELLSTTQPLFSNVLFALPGRNSELPAVAVAVPITGEEGQSLGTVVGFFRLVEMRDFAHLGRDVSIVVPVGEEADRADVFEAGARRGIRVPRIVVDPEARVRWARVGERLEGLEGGVDPEVYARFQDIRAFLAEHPFPGSSELTAVSGSDWDRPVVVERWVALNEALASAAVGRLSQFREGL